MKIVSCLYLCFVALPLVANAQTVLFDLDLTAGPNSVHDDRITVSGGEWDNGWRFQNSGDRIVIDAGRKLRNGLLEVWFTKRGSAKLTDGTKGQWLSLHEQGGGLAPEYAQLRAGRESYGFSKMRAKSNEKAVSKKSGALTDIRCEVKGGDLSDWITDDTTVMHAAIRWENGNLSFTIPSGQNITCDHYWQYPPPYIIDSLRYAYLGSDTTGDGAGLPGLRFQRVRFVDLGDAPAEAQESSGFGEKVIGHGELAEWTVNNPSFDGNPFDVVATVDFSPSGSGTARTTEMFYVGNNQWRFRFNGAEPGKWTLKTASSDPELDNLKGTVVVEEAAHSPRGFIANIGSKWGWTGNGEAFVPQYVMGKDLKAFFDFSSGTVDQKKIDAEIQEFVVEHGFTGFHVQGREAWFSLDGDPGEDPNPDPRTYAVLESVVKKVHEAGGACHIWMWGADGKKKGDGPRYILGDPMNDADQRNLRYFAARMAAIPGWTMGYGFDTENLWASPDELSNWKNFLEARLGWDHFLGSRVGFDEKGRWGRYGDGKKPKLNEKHNAPIGDDFLSWPGGDYIGYTSYRPLYDRYVEAIEHQPGRPSFEEDRFRLREAAQWTHKDYDPELMLKGLWHSAMAGGVANIWGNLLPDDDQGGSQPFDHGDVQIKDQIKTYATFFRDKKRFGADLIRDNSLADHRIGTTEVPEAAPISVCLRNPEQTRFLFYKESTDRVAMDLSKMSEPQPAIAVDTQKPYAEIEIGMMQPGRQHWKAPYESTWAIAVGRFGDPLSETNRKQPTSEVGRFEVYEQEFDAAMNYQNPYKELQPEAICTLPDGSTRRLRLFWDGSKTWRLRVSPDIVGRWSYKIHSADKGLDSQQGSFRCIESKRSGGIKVMHDAQHHFQRQDGSPFLFWGDTAWGLFLDQADENLDRDSVFHYIDQRSKQGINVIHSMLLSEAGWGNSGGPAFHNLNAESLNPAYWQEIDARLSYLNQRGIVGGLVLAWAFKGSNPLSWQDFPSMEARKRYIDYVAARYAAFDIYFILAGEWNLRQQKSPDALEQLRSEYEQMGKWLAAANANDRMIGMHPGFGTTRDWDTSAWTSFGDYQQNYPEIHQQVLQSQTTQGPIVNSEYGYLYRDMNSDGIVDKHNSFGSDDMRYATWDIIMAGGYPVTGYASTYMGGYRDKGPFNVDAPRNDPWEQQYHVAKRILTGMDWWKLAPHDDWIHSTVPRSQDRIKTVPYRKDRTRDAWRPPTTTYWLLAEPGRHYLVYARGVDGEVTIQLGSEGIGEYRARLINPTTGEMKPVGGKLRLQSEYKWTPPDDRDWVLHLINLTTTGASGKEQRPSPGQLSASWMPPALHLADTISLTDKEPGPAELLRLVEGGQFVEGGWQPTGKLDRLIIELADGFSANESGAVELDMTNLDFDSQVNGRKQHFFNLYADPTGDQFNLRNAFFTLRAGNYKNDEGHRGIKVLWRGDYVRGEHAPYAARPTWDINQVYTWRAEWDQQQLVVYLNGERVFGPAEFGERDNARPLSHLFLSRDGCLNEGLWFGFPGPIYKQIRTYRQTDLADRPSVEE